MSFSEFGRRVAWERLRRHRPTPRPDVPGPMVKGGVVSSRRFCSPTRTRAPEVLRIGFRSVYRLRSGGLAPGRLAGRRRGVYRPASVIKGVTPAHRIAADRASRPDRSSCGRGGSIRFACWSYQPGLLGLPLKAAATSGPALELLATWPASPSVPRLGYVGDLCRPRGRGARLSSATTSPHSGQERTPRDSMSPAGQATARTGRKRGRSAGVRCRISWRRTYHEDAPKTARPRPQRRRATPVRAGMFAAGGRPC